MPYQEELLKVYEANIRVITKGSFFTAPTQFRSFGAASMQTVVKARTMRVAMWDARGRFFLFLRLIMSLACVCLQRSRSPT